MRQTRGSRGDKLVACFERALAQRIAVGFADRAAEQIDLIAQRIVGMRLRVAPKRLHRRVARAVLRHLRSGEAHLRIGMRGERGEGFAIGFARGGVEFALRMTAPSAGVVDAAAIARRLGAGASQRWRFCVSPSAPVSRISASWIACSGVSWPSASKRSNSARRSSCGGGSAADEDRARPTAMPTISAITVSTETKRMRAPKRRRRRCDLGALSTSRPSSFAFSTSSRICICGALAPPFQRVKSSAWKAPKPSGNRRDRASPARAGLRRARGPLRRARTSRRRTLCVHTTMTALAFFSSLSMIGGVVLARRERAIPPHVEAAPLQRFGERAHAIAILAGVGNEDVRHARTLPRRVLAPASVVPRLPIGACKRGGKMTPVTSAWGNTGFCAINHGVSRRTTSARDLGARSRGPGSCNRTRPSRRRMRRMA